jgi:hypothetical protein
MLLSEFQIDNRKATVSKFSNTYMIDFYVNGKHIQRVSEMRINEAEKLAEDFVHEGSSPIFLTE